MTGRLLDRKLHANEHAPVIRELFKRAFTEGLRPLLRWLTTNHPEVGITDIAIVNSILRNRIYTGKIETVGAKRRNPKLGIFEKVPGSGIWVDSHEALVSTEDFDRIQDLMAKRNSSKGRMPGEESLSSHLMLREGIARCGVCGSAMASHCVKVPKHKNYVSPLMPTKPYRPYYVCTARKYGTCANRFVGADVVDPLIVAELGVRLEKLRGQLTQAMNAPQKDDKRPDFEGLLAAVGRKRGRLLELNLEEKIDKTRFVERDQLLEEEERGIRDARASWDLEHRRETPAGRKDLLRAVNVVRQSYVKLTVGERRALLQRLASHVEILSVEKGLAPAPKLTIAWHELPALGRVCANGDLTL